MPVSAPVICPHHRIQYMGKCPLCAALWVRRKSDLESRRGSARDRGYTRTWEKVRRIKLNQTPLCERCTRGHKIKPADMVHHKDHNQFNNHMDNLESLCRDCHNQEHKGAILKRPAMIPDLQPSGIPINIICGPPGSGKTAYCQQNMVPGDTLIDIDIIKAKLSGLPIYHAGDEWLNKSIAERNAKLIKLQYYKHKSAWLVASYPSYQDRKRMAEMLKAKVTVLEVGPDECKKRIMNDKRRPQWAKIESCKAVDRWWKNYVSGTVDFSKEKSQ